MLLDIFCKYHLAAVPRACDSGRTLSALGDVLCHQIYTLPLVAVLAPLVRILFGRFSVVDFNYEGMACLAVFHSHGRLLQLLSPMRPVNCVTFGAHLWRLLLVPHPPHRAEHAWVEVAPSGPRTPSAVVESLVALGAYLDLLLHQQWRVHYMLRSRVASEPRPRTVGALRVENVDVLSVLGEFQTRLVTTLPNYASKREWFDIAAVEGAPL